MFSFWRTYMFLFHNNRFQEIFHIIKLKILPQASQEINSCLFPKSLKLLSWYSTYFKSLIFSDVPRKAKFLKKGIGVPYQGWFRHYSIFRQLQGKQFSILHFGASCNTYQHLCGTYNLSHRKACDPLSFYPCLIGESELPRQTHMSVLADSRAQKLGNTENQPTRPLDWTKEMVLSCLFLLLMTQETSSKF